MTFVKGSDEYWMQHALSLAKRAELMGEVPVGAVIVLNGEILSEGWNSPITDHDPSAHAEIIALRGAGEKQENYRLLGSSLYVTLEPCVMCAGAMIHARISRLVFGASDPKSGVIENWLKLFDDEKFNHRVDYQGGVLKEECSEQLKQFFKARRVKSNKK